MSVYTVHQASADFGYSSAPWRLSFGRDGHALAGLYAAGSGFYGRSSAPASSWEKAQLGDTNNGSAQAVFILDSTHAWMATSGGKVWFSSDNCQTWTQIGNTGDQNQDIVFVDALHGFIGGNSFYRTSDGGATWTEVTGTGGRIVKLTVFTNQVIAFGTESGTVGISRDGGQTFTVTAVNSYMNKVVFIDENTIIGAGGYADFQKSTDGGATWSHISDLPSPLVYGVNNGLYMFDALNGVAIGMPGSLAYGQIAITADGGQTWTLDAQINMRTWGFEVLGRDIYVGTSDGLQAYIYRLSDGGVQSYNINSSATAGGSISPDGITSVQAGNSQAYAIAADPGYILSDVVVDGISVGAVTSYTFTNVQAAHNIAAIFEAAPSTYTITATAGTGGTITPSGAVDVAYGDDQAFTIAPSSGWSVLDVLVDGESVGAVTSYTFENVTEAHTIAASFEQHFFSSEEKHATPERNAGLITPDRLRKTATTARKRAFSTWHS